LNSILLVFILASGGLCLLALFLPFHLSLKTSKKGNSMEGAYSIAWSGIPLKKGSIFPHAAKIAGPDERNVPKKSEEKRPGSVFRLIQGGSPNPQYLMDALPSAIGIIVDLFKSIEVDVSCNLLFGLDDPADTAVLSGCFWSVASATGIPKADISLVPWFEGQRFEGWFAAEMRARILSLAVAMFRFLKEKKTRRLMMEMARSGSN
jgi:hypothetical protein